MNPLNHWRQITSFLADYENIWRTEVLYNYPQFSAAFPGEWMEELQAKSIEEIYGYNYLRDHSIITGAHFRAFLAEVLALEQLPRFTASTASTASAPGRNLKWQGRIPLRGIRGKKEHEILQLLNLFGCQKFPFRHCGVVDVGGGMGHLSQALSGCS
jgi:hypothetical protein